MAVADYLTPREICDLLDVSIWTVYRWIDRGLLDSYRVAGRVRVSREAFDRFAREHASGHTLAAVS